MLENYSYIKYPKYCDYPSNLLTGFKSNEPKIVIGKKILIILDITGSMGESINNQEPGTKLTFAKKIIKRIIDEYPFSVIEIMPFNDNPRPIISFNDIPEPGGCTYFSPILPEVTKIIGNNSEYTTTILMSDGLPTEPADIAHSSIRALGSYCREAGVNTISVAIGTEADGNACSLFIGNRGYNCFVKFEKDIEDVTRDIINGIKCNYVEVKDGHWIPLEESGNYYFLGSQLNGQQMMPTYETTRKYISLIIQNELQNPNKINIDNLKSFIKETVSCLANETERNEMIAFFNKSLDAVNNTIKSFIKTPSVMAAVKQVYQTHSSCHTGI